MLLGILSDSHGRAEVTRCAVRALLDAGAETLIHLGDIETETILDELVGHDARIVFGNCDWNLAELTRYAAHVGIAVEHPVGRIEADDRTVVFTHGHLPEPMSEAIATGADYLLHGHTHVRRDERIGRTRVINPGALFRASRYTAVVLDTVADRVSEIEVPKPA